jgi:predicted secreted protein
VSIGFAAAIYFIVWWIVLFAMLPFGVKTVEEAGETLAPGSADSAPHKPRMLPKMIATTIVASIIFAGIYAVVVHHVIRLDDIPFLPRYEQVQ